VYRMARPLGATACSGSGALTKRALVDGDCESFPFQRRWRADLGKSAADVAISESGLPPGDMAHFPRKYRCCVNQKAERISKWDLFASPNRFRTLDLLVNSEGA